MKKQSQNPHHILRTPLIPFYSFNMKSESSIFLKPENLQPFGSFKSRGVDSLFKNTPAHKLEKGVSAASAGNMGQSLAYMASVVDVACTIYVPDTTPTIKKERILNLGANLIELPFDKLWQFITHPPFASSESFFVHPVFTESLLIGYEKIAEEIIADLPNADAIIIPFGIGGLAIAISRAIKRLKPDTSLYICEPETAAPFKTALKNNAPHWIQTQTSFVDAIGTPEVLPYVFEQLTQMGVDSQVVKIEDIENAVKMLLFQNKLLCEGAAACSLAAAINLSQHIGYKNIVCILSGGNLSTEYLNLTIT